MDKTQLVCLLQNIQFDVNSNDYQEFYKINIEKTMSQLAVNFEEITGELDHFTKYFTYKLSDEWKFICVNFYILHLINCDLSKSDDSILSVKETDILRKCLDNLLTVSVLKNLQPSLPYYVELNTNNDVFHNYYILKSSVVAFINYTKCPDLRLIILPDCLKGLLVALHQLAFCKLKKPANCSAEQFTQFQNDQVFFRQLLDDLRKNIHPTIFVRQTMILYKKSVPLWFGRALSRTLTEIIRSKKGVESIISAILTHTDDDITSSWNKLNILTKLIISCRNFDDFQSNICGQLNKLLDSAKRDDQRIYERLYGLFLKQIHSFDQILFGKLLEKCVINVLDLMVSMADFPDNLDITADVNQNIRLIYEIFVEKSGESGDFPGNFPDKIVSPLVQFYVRTSLTEHPEMHKACEEILGKYLKNTDNLSPLFDSLFFGFATSFFKVRNDVSLEINDKIVLKKSAQKIIYTSIDVARKLFNLLSDSGKVMLFGYLLNCLVDKTKYFECCIRTDETLINFEDNPHNITLERLLTVHELLSKLSDDRNVQNAIKCKPDDIIKYINKVFTDADADDSNLFLMVMILDNLIGNASDDALVKYRSLHGKLEEITRTTANKELEKLVMKLIDKLNGPNRTETESKKYRSDFSDALNDMSDPLLPVRGHGLLVLGKLIRQKDPEAMERKQFLLNAFQMHLKDADTFIYLNAVEGLAALADVFPDQIIEVLCEEYVDFGRKSGDEDRTETRIKLGEVLVRVVKMLGEIAPKYKTLLLNAILTVVRDDDHLIRASGLANLGEICRILGYKLGTIYTEVLVCVHAIIATDKAVEARRAAVTVIRQLLTGLEKEMLVFLKDDILIIYRTLKDIYYNDKDEVMRLQAQLALEELNENVKEFFKIETHLYYDKTPIRMN